MEPSRRLPLPEVVRLDRVLSGDPVTEDLILRFIGHRYGARNLFYVPAKAAAEILRRPADFFRAVKSHFEPELQF